MLGTAAAVALLGAALLSLHVRPTDPSELILVAIVVTLLFGIGCCGVALALLLRERYESDPMAAWLLTTQVMCACYLLARAIPMLLQFAPGRGRLGPIDERLADRALFSLHLTDVLLLVFCAVLLHTAASGRRARGVTRPLVLGPLLGLGLALISEVRRITAGPPPDRVLWGAMVLVLAGVLVAGSSLWRMRGFSPSVRVVLITAGCLQGLALLLLASDTGSADVLWLALLAQTAGAVAGPSAAVLALRDSLAVYQRRLVALEGRAHQVEQVLHQDQEVLHEVRASLAGINAAATLLAGNSGSVAPERVEMLRHLVDAELLRMLNLVGAAEDELGTRALDLNQELAQIVTAHRFRGLEITSELSSRPDAVRVVANPDHLRQALNVLLHNVSRHAPASTVRITAATTGPAERPHVELRVSDDGPGVPREVAPQLFQRRVKGARSPGEGLGLASARRVLREDGADIRHESGEIGATFVITLDRCP